MPIVDPPTSETQPTTSSSSSGSAATGSAATGSAATGSASNTDLFSVLGGLLKECTNQWNQDANGNLDILTRDVKNLYSQFGSLVYQNNNMLQLSAEEIRNKTVEDLYKQIKFGILSCRNNCKYVHTTSCQSQKILDDLHKKLTNEGFTVTYEIQSNQSIITISW